MGSASFDLTDSQGNVTTVSGTFNVSAPSSGPILGMNFEPPGDIATFNAPYEKQARIARIYVGLNQTNILNENEYVRAKGLGITEYAFSWKDTATTAFTQCVNSIKAQGIKWRGITHHEPEDDIHDGGFTLAQWKGWQQTFLPIIAAAGGTPATCLMSYTVNPASGRNVADYKLPSGLSLVQYWDYYPNKEPKPTQAQCVAWMKAGNQTLGISRYGFAEYGILNNSAYNASTVTAFKALVPDAESLMYWSNQQAENQKFTPSVAAAFYA